MGHQLTVTTLTGAQRFCRTTIMKKCQQCKGEIKSKDARQKFCGVDCGYKGRRVYRGIPRTEEVKQKIRDTKAKKPRLGKDASNWRGGKPRCKLCEAECSYGGKVCIDCRAESQQGENHPNWKGGISIGENHREYTRHALAKRKALKMEAEGDYTVKEWIKLLEKHEYTCLCCKKKAPFVTLSVDHIVPLVLGGTNYIDNIQPLCRSCNSKKHTKIIDYR